MRYHFLAGVAILFCVSLPASALSTLKDTNAPAIGTPSEASSLTTHLQMETGQIEKIDRLYEKHAEQRTKQEARVIQWQQQLRSAQSPTSFDERTANRLLRDISRAQEQVASDILARRVQALKVLTPIQRAQLEAVVTDGRIKLHRDRYYQLLVLPVEEVWQVAPDSAQMRTQPSTRRSEKRREHRPKGTGSYGVYGGYGYGQPHYGVYGNYGQGGIGVHAGIGNHGPTIGIGIGRVFGGWFR